MSEGASPNGLREIFDDISSQTIKYLENREGVSKVLWVGCRLLPHSAAGPIL